MNSASRERSTSSADGSQSSSPDPAFTAAAYLEKLSFWESRSGGTGIRDRLKIDCPYGLVGSNPTSGICLAAADAALRRTQKTDRSGRLRGVAPGAGAVFLAG